MEREIPSNTRQRGDAALEATRKRWIDDQNPRHRIASIRSRHYSHKKVALQIYAITADYEETNEEITVNARRTKTKGITAKIDKTAPQSK